MAGMQLGTGTDLSPVRASPLFKSLNKSTRGIAEQPGYVDVSRVVFSHSRCPTGCRKFVSEERKQPPPPYCQGFIVRSTSELSFHLISSRCYSTLDARWSR